LALLEVGRLTVHYGKALSLEEVSLSVAAGELVTVLGPNGAGKSTLLKAVSRAHPSTGRLEFKGRSLQGLAAHEVVAQGICHCPEGRRLFAELSVSKNLELGAYLRHDKDAVHTDREAVYAMFPVLRARLAQQASTLSGGEQQMLAIARALMGRPALLLLDEPSVGIAHRLKIEIFTAIRSIREQGTAILMAEQDAQNALAIADRCYVLEQGRVAREGAAHEMLKDDTIRRSYLGI
jgi:branched-chain amino acid transport system ATP-binding protein